VSRLNVCEYGVELTLSPSHPMHTYARINATYARICTAPSEQVSHSQVQRLAAVLRSSGLGLGPAARMHMHSRALATSLNIGIGHAVGTRFGDAEFAGLEKAHRFSEATVCRLQSTMCVDAEDSGWCFVCILQVGDASSGILTAAHCFNEGVDGFSRFQVRPCMHT
jgi:hypothetical protein